MVLEQSANIAQDGPVNVWNLQVGQELCHDVWYGLDREWLVTNGLGGYASGSLVGATTRSYHGLLVAALSPPVDRMVLVTKIDEEVTLASGEVVKLGVNEYQESDVVDPQGYRYLDSVALEGDIPCFRYQLTETLSLEKRIWMEYGQNTTYVQYIVHSSSHEASAQAVKLSLLPFCVCRDYHATLQGDENWHFRVDSEENRCSIQAYASAPSFHLVGDPQMTFTPTGLWYWHVLHRRDRERGLPDLEDVYQPGIFQVDIQPDQHLTLVLSAEEQLPQELGTIHHNEMVNQAYARHLRRIRQLFSLVDQRFSDLPQYDPVLARLVLSADQFIVARSVEQAEDGSSGPLQLSPARKTIIAGYPWFTDWGRDSMIALPGLLLCTGRYSEARGLLKAFTSFMHNGLIPNRFPDNGASPEYNTADATLWLFHALENYLETTNDWSLLKELFPILSQSMEWHIRGTDYAIGLDQSDGLLHAGVPGMQLTWMDARVDDWVVTPRRGKPVEINALWYRALTLMEGWAIRLSIDATQYSQLRTLFRQHFAARFWYEEGGYLYDVVDVDGVSGQNDPALRPNQLFAASLTSDLLSELQVSSILEKVTQHLLTPVGLRSLSPTDPAYHAHFNGDRVQRDSAYHQGAVWQWLIGPYIDVHFHVHNDRAALRELLQPLVQQFWSPCLGSLSEVAEPEAPFTPAGCFAQAWSVGEVLRCWLLART
ncbi:MAG TPA: amylo-alpha-1,6-glucosidase [Ktedonobacteraceae bacterium]